MCVNAIYIILNACMDILVNIIIDERVYIAAPSLCPCVGPRTQDGCKIHDQLKT